MKMKGKKEILFSYPIIDESKNHQWNFWIDKFIELFRYTLKELDKSDYYQCNVEEKYVQKQIELLGNENVVIALIPTFYELDKNFNPTEFTKEIIDNDFFYPILVGNSLKNLEKFPDLITHSYKLITAKHSKFSFVKAEELLSPHSYDMRLVIYDIANEIISKSIEGKEEQEEKHKKTILLAECNSDLDLVRNNLKREFINHHATILPKKNFPLLHDEFQKAYSEMLIHSDLIIQLVGNEYLPVFENGESVQLIQDQLYQKHIDKHKNIPERLIWVSPDVKPQDDNQKAIVLGYVQNTRMIGKTEVIQAPIEVFKSYVTNKLQREKSFVNQDENTKEPADSVYFITDENDEEKINQIKNTINKCGFEFCSIHSSNSFIESILLHKKLLVNCNGLVIYSDKKNLQWWKSKIRDIQKSPGYGRKSNFDFVSMFVHSDLIDSIEVPFQAKIMPAKKNVDWESVLKTS